MLTVIIPRERVEQTVIDMTRDNLTRELKSVIDSELLITKDWGEGISKCKTEFICLVEPDCEVQSGYFASMMGLFKKNPAYRQMGILSSATSVVHWPRRIYGYDLASSAAGGVIPVKEKKSTEPYRAQIVYIPGSIIRLSTLKRVLDNNRKNHIIGSGLMKLSADLIFFSTMMSLAFWRLQSHIYINPNSSYCTTEDYVEEQGVFDCNAYDIYETIKRETR